MPDDGDPHGVAAVTTGSTKPTIAEARTVLAHILGDLPDLQPLEGGYWSAAFAYTHDGQDLVLRVGSVPEGFLMDRAAWAFDRPGLPVPEVLDVGVVDGQAYAVSVRHHGRFLERIEAREAAAAAPAVDRLLGALRSVEPPAGAQAGWFEPEAAGSWRDHMRSGLVDDPTQRTAGWRKTLARDDRLDQLFRDAEQRIGTLLPACPERRDLVHADLINQNVLLAPDLSAVTAVFSWKCSTLGDFLFDTAWCTFWSPWHPGIEAMDLWSRTLAADDLSEADLVDAPLRHHCYELQVGASHLGWNTWTGDAESLTATADRLEAVLARGPCSA